MKEIDKDQLVKRVKDLESNLSGIKQILDPVPEGGGDSPPATAPNDQTSSDEGATLHVTKKSGSALTEKDLRALKQCAKLKGFTIRDILDNPAKEQS